MLLCVGAQRGKRHVRPGSLVVSSPVLGAPAINQIHLLVANSFSDSSPIIGSGTLHQIYTLTANSLTDSSPVFGTPTVILPVPTTFSLTDKSANITTSNGDRTASYSGTTTDAAIRCVDYKSSGSYYIEFTVNNTLTGGDAGVGAAISTATLGNIANIASGAFIVFRSGNIWASGSNTGKTLGSIATNGTGIGVVIDRSNGKGYARILPSGNWNGDPAADPATNTGGVPLPAGAMTPCVTFGGSGGTNVPNNFTLNPGQSAFTGTVPSGSTSGWLS